MTKKKQSFILFHITGILLFLLSCNREQTQIHNTVILTVGDFEVTSGSFTGILDKVSKYSLNKAEAGQTLLENYISAGILIEMARKKGYQKTIAEPLYQYKLQLYRKYNMLKRCGSVKVPKNIKANYADFYRDSIQIDYLWVPLQQKELAAQLYERMESGAGVENLLGNSLIDEWNKSGLRFYSKISPEVCLPTEKVWDKIRRMKEKEVCLLSTKSGFHIIKLIERRAKPESPEKDNNLLLVINSAYALENGDTLLSSYALKNKVEIDKKLLSSIDLSIDPLTAEANTSDPVIATVKDQIITEQQLKKEIYQLPGSIRAFFKNISTREKAVAILLLSRFADNNKALNKKTDAESYSFWTTPETSGNLDILKLNFQALHRMEIPEEKVLTNRQLIASSGKWRLTVTKFKEAIHKLSPESKIELFKENAAARAIQYIARKNGKIANPEKLKINNQLVNETDILENAMDSINLRIEENAIAGTLLNKSITVGDLRRLIAPLPENEKNKFKNVRTRENAFKDLLVQKFWCEVYKSEVAEKNPDFQKELKEYENWLLARAIYKQEILATPVETLHEQSNFALRKAAIISTNERLHAFCQKSSKELNIKANAGELRRLGIHPSSSYYGKVIHVY